MILEELSELYDDLEIDSPTPAQSEEMYHIFMNDFVNKPMTINDMTLKVNENKSKHPLFKGKLDGFVHLVTRESKYSGKRNFDNQRANRIHWIRPILENVTNNRVKYFERINDKGIKQYHYWLKENDFLVILREIKPDILLVTSFIVDVTAKFKYQRWYDEFNNKPRYK